jgi:short-subunit dehydrogenase
VRNTVEPKVYLVGRNEAQASAIIEELKKINPGGTSKFIKSDLTLLKNVDAACEEIRSQEEKVNLLCLSQGYLSVENRNGMPVLSPGYSHLF